MQQLSIEDLKENTLSNKIDRLKLYYEEFKKTKDLIVAIRIGFLQNDILEQHGWSAYKLTKVLTIK